MLNLALISLVLGQAGPARADGIAAPEAFRCDGDPLQATVHSGAVDDPGFGDGPLPGAFVVLEWRGLSLQLPRTNNAGPASYSDGKWWWSAASPQRPGLKLRRGLGDVQTFGCERLDAVDNGTA